ncbi:hypothetical protein EJ02DRAFT_493622, partial [Clathrospora elynae]
AKEELRNVPLVWWNVKQHMGQMNAGLQQYAVMGNVPKDEKGSYAQPVLLNTNSPWSAFLCGSQGSGKSHALSCMLEDCLLVDPNIGQNPLPLAGIVFHYDRSQGSDVCEAAYLCSSVPTKVLVSASNYGRLKGQYEAIARQCKTTIEVLKKILRDMAIETGGLGIFNYDVFTGKLDDAGFSDVQNNPLNQRLDLLETFVDVKPRDTTAKVEGKLVTKKHVRNPKRSKAKADMLRREPGTLTIIDLTDPVVDSDSACALFDICLSIFISQTTCGKIIALDEAHNYMGGNNAAAANFTERLLKSIREQRHQGARVVIATQEPSIDPRLLDLCNVTMVHRCTSPAWFAILKEHLAALSGKDGVHVFGEIVQLKTGECLLFCPTAAIAIDEKMHGITSMNTGYFKFRTRKRITADGGRSKLADDGISGYVDLGKVTSGIL